MSSQNFSTIRLYIFSLVSILYSIAQINAAEFQQIGSWNYGPSNGVCARSDTLFTINGGVLQIIDMSDPANPVELGAFITPDIIIDMVIRDNTVFFINQYDGFWIIDISDIHNPTLISHDDDLGIGYPDQMAIEDNFAYIAGSNLHIIDISDLQAPANIATHILQNPQDIVVRDGIAFIPTSSEGTFIIDFNDPANPDTLSNIPTENRTLGVALQGQYLFLADSPAGMRILDISNLSDPVEVGSFYTGSIPKRVAIMDTLALIPASTNGLKIVSIADMTNPKPINSIYFGQNCRHVAIGNNKLFITLDNGGLAIVDISELEADLSFIRYHTGGSIIHMDYRPPYLYASQLYDGLEIFDISDPGNIQSVHLLTMEDLLAKSFQIQGQYLYLAANKLGIMILDITNPESPTIAALFDSIRYTNVIMIEDDQLFVSDLYDSLFVLDVSDLNEIEIKSSLFIDKDIDKICKHGDRLYINSSTSGLTIVDVSDPVNPYIHQTIEPFNRVNDIAIYHNYLYATDNRNGLRIFDLTDPNNPVERDMLPETGYDGNLFILNAELFISDNTMGLRAFDLTDPTLPEPIASMEKIRGADFICASGDTVILEKSNAGYRIMLLTTETAVSSANNKPTKINLAQNFPNPFNPETVITYQLDQKQPVSIELFNITGQKVRTLYAGHQTAGTHRLTLNASGLPAGLYFYRLIAGEYIAVKKCLLIK